MVLYTVKQGDYLAAIAKDFGFSDPDKIWDFPANSELKQQRVNPNVLLPGDSLVIPDFETQEIPCPTDNRHVFVLKDKPLSLRIRLAQAFSKPMTQLPCDLTIDSDSNKAISDSNAEVANPCPNTAQKARVVAHTQVPYGNNTIPLDIGFDAQVGWLDPIDTPSGQLNRLSNLGYYVNFDKANQDADLESAIEEFQCDNHLKPVDGICGPATQAKLKAVHGS